MFRFGPKLRNEIERIFGEEEVKLLRKRRTKQFPYPLAEIVRHFIKLEQLRPIPVYKKMHAFDR